MISVENFPQPLDLKERRQLAFLAAFPDAMITFDINGKIVEWNSGAEKLLGHVAEEAMDKDFTSLLIREKEEQANCQSKIKTYLKNGNSNALNQLMELKLCCKNQGDIYGELQIIPISVDNETFFTCTTRDITKRINTKKVLNEFYALADNIPHLTWMANADGHILWYNKRWFDYTGGGGSSPDKMQGWHPQSSVDDPTILTSFMERWADFIQQGQAFDMIFPIKRKDGVFRSFLTHVIPINDQEGNLIRWFGINTDITEQLKIEDALRASETQLRAIIDATPECIKIVDYQGILQYINASGLNMIEAEDDVIGNIYACDLVAPECRDTWIENHHRVCSGEKLTWEYNIITLKSKKCLSFEIYAVPLTQPNGSVSHLAVTREITHRKQAIAALKESERRFRAIADCSPIMIWMLDIQTYKIYYNKSLLEFLGQQNEQVAYVNLQPLIHPEDFPFTTATLNRAITEKIPLELECRVLRQDGAYRWLLSKGSPRLNEKGDFLGYVGSLIDVTERKETRQLLESLVKERTTQLEQANLQLQYANKELESFSYSVSHDLRAPLRSVDGFSAIILKDYADKLDETGKDYLNRIRVNSQKMGGLINNLLELSQVNQTELKKKPVNLSLICSETLNRLISENSERSINIQIEPNVIVNADPILIRTVLENLLENAWKFTSSHASTFIEFGVLTSHEIYIYYIKDDGAGFDMTYINKLFNPFQRLHHSSDFVGTGIGLATVQRIIRRHGGDIWAESEVEKGATFYFTLEHSTLK